MRNISDHEHAVLDLLGRAYISMSGLKPAHPYDLEEFALHIHAAQNIVLARPGTEVIAKKSGELKKILQELDASSEV